MWGSIVKTAGVIAGILVLSGCIPGSSLRTEEANRRLQWPPSPLPARITWVKEIRGAGDGGVGKGFWNRFGTLLSGGDEDEQVIGKPYGVYVDARRRLFIVDSAKGMVHIIDMQEKKYSTIGGGDDNPFRIPIAITEDDEEQVYITDPGGGVVYRYNLRDGSLKPFVSLDAGRPTGIAFNVRNRLLYVVDTAAHQIVVFDLKGQERFRIGNRGDAPGRFNYPTDLAIDRNGQVYVSDALNGRVQILKAEGTFVRAFGSPGDSEGAFARPKGIAVDRDGHIYVADGVLDTIKIFNDAGQILLELGGNGVGAGQFQMPSGIFIDDSGLIYVADTLNRRIQVFRYLGDAGMPDEKP